MKAALALLAVVTIAVATQQGGPQATSSSCAAAPDDGYAQRIKTVLRAGRDLWGEELLAAQDGPSYDGASKYLRPLVYARAAGGTPLTRSGVYYLPFSHPTGPGGATSVALHVADGSEILAHRVDGKRIELRVGGERYGACLGRLTAPRLADGYLPILQTAYEDANGVGYRQESFAARVSASGPLTSFVRLTVDARTASRGTHVRFTSPGSSLSLRVRRGAVRVIAVSWPLSTTPSRVALDAYDRARRMITGYWRSRLAEGTAVEVPERRVMNAQRALIVQNLALTWRYSVGNPYQQFSYPEGVDAAEVMSTFGHANVARAMLRTALTRRPTEYPNWSMGQKLVGSALYFRLFRDRAFLAAVTPVLQDYVDELGRQLDDDDRGLLQRERFSSDIPDVVYGLHSQAIAWQGLRWIGLAWAETGRAVLADQCRRLAERLERGLRAAVRSSQARLPDGSLFLPARLFDAERPYHRLTATRAGSYWNLVVPYALASGLFQPGSAEAEGAMRYLLLHGSRMLGLVRAGAYALYGRTAPFPTSGTDQVYGLNVARFLAQNDRPDQLALGLYGQLAAAMTPGTFVAGEAASVTPLPGQHGRSMYLPPNGAANATYLGTLRLLLVHETLDAKSRPTGLELAYATPRAWLEAGKRIAVRRAPTSFGPLSYSIRSSKNVVRVSIDVPRGSLRALSVRLRLPHGDRITRALLGGGPLAVDEGTIELPTRPGRLDVLVAVERG